MDDVYADNSSKKSTNEPEKMKAVLDDCSNSNIVYKFKIILSIFFYFLMQLFMMYIYKYIFSFDLILREQMVKVAVLNAVSSQIQVLISIYLVMNCKNMGYKIAVILNSLSIICSCEKMIIDGNMYALTNIILLICTLLIIKKINSIQVINNKPCLNKVFCENDKSLNNFEYYDELTGLPNRKMIIESLDCLINLSLKQKVSFAVVFIDLENFKKINATMGHLAGDLLLREVAGRLNECVCSDDMLGRFGGDEFLLIIERDIKEKSGIQYVENIKSSFNDLFEINGVEISVKASIGISTFPADGHSSGEIVKHAGIAMNKARDYGKNRIQFYDRSMDEEIISKYAFDNNLRTSIKNNELFLVFQPQYSSSTKHLRGFEVLVRWNSIKLGYLNPSDFIPLAEESGFIVTMGEWIIKSACNHLKYIQDKFHIKVVMSVNISVVQMMEPNFANMVKEIIEETGVDSSNLEFEITESVFISSIEHVKGVLHELNKMGISIALDDFGTGYSSLNYLHMLPINVLKIDKSFIEVIDKNSTQRNMVRSIISLVHEMGIKVVAEGVENETQIKYLNKYSCDYIQCFMWGTPVNSEGLNSMLEKYDE